MFTHHSCTVHTSLQTHVTEAPMHSRWLKVATKQSCICHKSNCSNNAGRGAGHRQSTIRNLHLQVRLREVQATHTTTIHHPMSTAQDTGCKIQSTTYSLLSTANNILQSTINNQVFSVHNQPVTFYTIHSTTNHQRPAIYCLQLTINIQHTTHQSAPTCTFTCQSA